MSGRVASALAALACLSGAAAAEPAPCAEGPAVTLTGASCGELQPPRLSCRAPEDVEGGLAQPNTNTVQRAANVFSWRQLIALSWPARGGRRGEPAAGLPLAAPGPRVWQTWKEAYEIYRPRGRRPAAWNTPQRLPGACGGRAPALARTSKVSDVVDQVLQALPADATLPSTIKDQQGRLVRYEIRLNRTLFEYIVARRLHDGRVQARADEIDFPDGSQLVKAAWRELDAEPAGRFLETEACVCATPADCRVTRMGLAGFHLMTKTASAPRWIWSTFEHRDNIVSRDPSVASLNDPGCPPSRCPPNQQTADGVPTQLARVVPVPDRAPRCEVLDGALDDVARLNDDMERALRRAGSPLASYELIGTQWPVPEGGARPRVLANTTMETFSQETSTCLGCHAMARTLRPDRAVGADFSFTLNNAEPRPARSRCQVVEGSGSCDDRTLGPPPAAPPRRVPAATWAKVRRGHEIATRTFELLGGPGGPVGNRLHCESCHLQAGGDPDAAWWVDMRKAYPPAPGSRAEDALAPLQARINSCFEHSMNGRPLCAPGSDCNGHQDMISLIAYIDWLTTTYHSRHRGKPPARGFPGERDPESSTPGDASRGRAVYAERCAFCHGADGAGRYAHDTYFRPALWGPASYNAAAGMGKAPLLTAFVHANMPFTSGGLLSWRDARDVAAFIDGRCRPGKTKDHDGLACPP